MIVMSQMAAPDSDVRNKDRLEGRRWKILGRRETMVRLKGHRKGKDREESEIKEVLGYCSYIVLPFGNGTS